MKNWTPPSEPDKDHPQFPFDRKKNKPWKDRRWEIGTEPPQPVAKPSSAKEQFEAMCSVLIRLVEQFNFVTMKCKEAATGTAQQIAAAKKNYDIAVGKLNQFIGRPRGNSDAGYHKFLKPGSLKIEAVVSGGFTIAVRVLGVPGVVVTQQSEGQPVVHAMSYTSSSSSSHYIIYPPR